MLRNHGSYRSAMNDRRKLSGAQSEFHVDTQILRNISTWNRSQISIQDIQCLVTTFKKCIKLDTILHSAGLAADLKHGKHQGGEEQFANSCTIINHSGDNI